MAKTRKRRKFLWHRLFIFILICLLLIFAVRFAVSTDYRQQVVNNITSIFQKDGDSEPAGTQVTGENIKLTSEAAPGEPANLKYTKLELAKEDYKNGDLILVNNDHEYDFVVSQPAAVLKNLAENNQEAYPVYYDYTMVAERIITPLNTLMADFKAATGLTDVTILSGFRTKEYQQELYDNKQDEVGQAKASEWVAKPGFSEHHTGLCIDFSILDGNGALRYSEEGDYAWLLENAYKYGFIKRYDDTKSTITQIMNEPWHYRYVGKPHAYLMKKNVLCLEEYIAALKNYPYGDEHLQVTTDEGEKYEIYYVKASKYKKIPVPKDKAYTVSGNNIDGFIVTVNLNEKPADTEGQG